jgi:hypothetical protein
VSPLDSLVPLVFVESVLRSIEFYGKLGFTVGNTFTPPGQIEPTWAWLESGGSHLMVTLASEPMDASQQAVIFCLYSEDVPSFHAALQKEGLELGEIEHPFYQPSGRFRIVDPDGFALMVTHL